VLAAPVGACSPDGKGYRLEEQLPTAHKQGSLTVYDRTPEDEVVERAKGTEIVLTNKTPLRSHEDHPRCYH